MVDYDKYLLSQNKCNNHNRIIIQTLMQTNFPKYEYQTLFVC